ncbi:unnamed protein product, partial [Nesidiocoris tenuis]
PPDYVPPASRRGRTANRLSAWSRPVERHSANQRRVPHGKTPPTAQTAGR